MANSKRNWILRQALVSLTCLAVIISILVVACEKPERVAKISTITFKSTDVSYTSATLRGLITDLGSSPIKDYGIVMSQNASFLNPTVTPETAKPSKDTFKIDFAGLTKNTTYFYRAYLTYNSITIYGESVQFKTKDTGKPELTTAVVSNITLTSAQSGGSISSDGGETVIKKGLCWSKSAGTDLSTAIDTTVSLNAGTDFTDNISGLDQGTTYYVRSYAINAKGTGYGNELSFTTLLPSSATTLAATSITVGTATLNGTVNANNSPATVTFEYGLTTSYGQSVAAIPGTVTGNTLSNVSAGLTGLTQGTTYHFRVKSVSQAGTVTGGDFTFTTLTPPSATTLAANLLTSTTAQLNGTVNANGSSTTVTFEYGLTTSYGSTVTATQSPATGNTAISVSAPLTGLTQGTTYHFRVKASSTAGTTTGTDQTFTTLIPPSATTVDATGVSATTAILNGMVNANNSSTVVTFEYGPTTSYGSTATASQSPVTGNTPTNVSATISGLTAATTYHFRVKAVSAGGTVYGSDFTVTTLVTPSTITDIEGNVYKTAWIGTQLWMQENLKTTKYNDGTSIPYFDFFDWNWITRTSEYYTVYNNDYGAFYNWYCVSSTHSLCPSGWHVPTDNEWTILTDYLGGADTAGGKLKESGLDHWPDPNTDATNESGFTALCAGLRLSGGTITGKCAGWWSSTPEGLQAWYKDVFYNSGIFGRGLWMFSAGFSVRCLKGELPITETDSATAIAFTSVTLNGRVNPNGASTAVSIEYGSTTSYGSEISASQSPVTGIVPVYVSAGLTGLTASTTYHYRTKAVNSGGTSYGSDMTFITTGVVDNDGNIYNTIKIGTQVWMEENLKSTKLNDNTPIPSVTDGTTWAGLSTPARSYYNNDSLTYANIYGPLYNWFTVNTGKLCPTGWHVPSYDEFVTLITYLGGTSIGGGHMKETGTTHWISPNTGADNNSGFTGLPGGHRMLDGEYANLGLDSYWWTNTQSDANNSWRFNLYNYSAGVGEFTYGTNAGFSVRCVKN